MSQNIRRDMDATWNRVPLRTIEITGCGYVARKTGRSRPAKKPAAPTALEFSLADWIPETEGLRRLEVALGAYKLAQCTLHDWRCNAPLETVSRCVHRNGRTIYERLGRSYWRRIPWEGVGINAAEIVAMPDGQQATLDECFCFDRREQFEALFAKLTGSQRTAAAPAAPKATPAATVMPKKTLPMITRIVLHQQHVGLTAPQIRATGSYKEIAQAIDKKIWAQVNRRHHTSYELPVHYKNIERALADY